MTKTYTDPRKENRMRLPQERERDLVQIASWYLRGYTHAEMARQLTNSRPYVVGVKSINRDIQEIRQRWLNSQLIDFNEAKARELERLDSLIEQYWQAWERSQQDAQETVTESLENKQTSTGGAEDGEQGRTSAYTHSKTRSKSSGRDGDVRFLERIENCIKMRCEILGLNAVTRSVVDINWRKTAAAAGLESVANEQFEEMVAKFAEAMSEYTEHPHESDGLA